MKYQVLFSLKNNEKTFINVVCCSPIGALCCSPDWGFKGKCLFENSTFQLNSMAFLHQFDQLKSKLK